MIIVNQDKDEIINFNNISNIFIYNPLNNNDGEFEINADDNLLGTYKTEERAKEVLKEIIKIYRSSEAFKHTREYETQETITRKLNKENLLLFSYEMPEE